MLTIDKSNYSEISIADFCENWTCDKDIPYRDNPEDEYMRERCKLDAYYPKDRKGVPALVFFHGGGLTAGSKEALKEHWKLLGCAIFSANYRLSPKVKCPEYMRDAAAAAAWVKRNAANYNADPDNVFVCGASAGAYLTSVLCTMPKFLAEYGCRPEEFRGYMPISGEMITHFTIRAERGIPNTVQIVDEYAPLSYVRPDMPPMLMVTGETGKEIDCRPGDNKLMRDALLFCGNKTAEYYELPDLTHGTVWNAAVPYMFDFIKKHLR